MFIEHMNGNLLGTAVKSLHKWGKMSKEKPIEIFERFFRVNIGGSQMGADLYRSAISMGFDGALSWVFMCPWRQAFVKQ